MSSQDFCTKLLEQKHVAIIPGDAFGASGEGYARISYAYSVEHLKEALRRIREYAAEYFAPEKVKLPRRDDPVQQREQAQRSELKRLKGEVERRRKAVQQLYLDKVSGLIDAVQFAEMNRAFGEEIKSAENRIHGLEAELEQQLKETDVVQAQRQRVRELAQVSHLTRELAALLVRRVVVSPKDPLTGKQEITIEWEF
jgi:site-specific DNA recombinase